MSLSESYQQRFGGIARLYGQEALTLLRGAHFVVVGLGGVGTWAAEALARSGVGELTLIEMDEICVTNTNRQLHALSSTVGASKLATLSSRLKDINPDINIHAVEDFLDRDNMSDLVGRQHHVVIDATDSAYVKSALAAYCSSLKMRLVMSGSSGGKRRPDLIQVSDLGQTSADAMLAKVRNQLYRHYKFAKDKNRKFRVDVIYSTEQMVYPKPDGSVCMNKRHLDQGVKLDCAGGFGSATMVTGVFGFMAASKGVERFLQDNL